MSRVVKVQYQWAEAVEAYEWLLAEARWWAEDAVAAIFPITGLDGLPWRAPSNDCAACWEPIGHNENWTKMPDGRLYHWHHRPQNGSSAT